MIRNLLSGVCVCVCVCVWLGRIAYARPYVVKNWRCANEFMALKNLAEFTNNSACFSNLISLLLRFVSIISKKTGVKV
ncbi:MAG: hypothetical protein LBF67_06845 [Prevotellaceae bacterium]|nr:hypothetical protein [Prevotellaceae bacterium]